MSMRDLSLTCNGKQGSLLCLKDSDMVRENFLPSGRHNTDNRLKGFTFTYYRAFVNCQCPMFTGSPWIKGSHDRCKIR